MLFILLRLNFMVRLTVKYLVVLGVVLFGFQHNAFADENEKKEDGKKTSSSVAKNDTIIIRTGGDITVGDTLVFDDFDEDEGTEKGENSSIAALIIPPASSNVGGNTNPDQEVDATTLGTTDQTYQSNVSETGDQLVTSSSETEERQEQLFSEPLDINVYPNPASQAFEPVTITHNLNSEVAITIFTLTGEVAQTMTTSEREVHISNLNSGMYIVQITGEDQQKSQRLIVQ